MEEMLIDPNLDKFRNQFEKLHGAWSEAKASNSRLQEKHRQVNAELVANAAKIAQTLKQTQAKCSVIQCSVLYTDNN